MIISNYCQPLSSYVRVMSVYVRISRIQKRLAFLFFYSYSAAVASNMLASPPPLLVTFSELDGSGSFALCGRCIDYSASASSTIARPAPTSTLPASWEGCWRVKPAKFWSCPEFFRITPFAWSIFTLLPVDFPEALRGLGISSLLGPNPASIGLKFLLLLRNPKPSVLAPAGAPPRAFVGEAL